MIVNRYVVAERYELSIRIDSDQQKREQKMKLLNDVMWVTAMQERTAQNTWWLQELSTSRKQKHDKLARYNSHNPGLLNRIGPVLQFSQGSCLLSGSPQSNGGTIFDCNRSRVRTAVLKSAVVEPQVFARQADLRCPWAVTGIAKLVTGREITPRARACARLESLRRYQRTKNFRLNVLSSVKHFRSTSCLCCSLQHCLAHVCPSSEDMKHPPPHPPLFSKRQWRNKSSV